MSSDDQTEKSILALVHQLEGYCEENDIDLDKLVARAAANYDKWQADIEKTGSPVMDKDLETVLREMIEEDLSFLLASEEDRYSPEPETVL